MSTLDIPVTHHLPLRHLLKLADPFLISKLCNTNIEAFNLVKNNPDFIPKIIHNLIKTKSNISRKYLLDVISKILRRKNTKLDLLILKHLLDYESFKEKNPKSFELNWIKFEDNINEYNDAFIEYYFLFCGTFQRLSFFFEYMKQPIKKCCHESTNVADFLFSPIICFAQAYTNSDKVEHEIIKNNLRGMISPAEYRLAIFFIMDWIRA